MKRCILLIGWVFLCRILVAQDSVVIKGYVTDYNGNPLDSVSLFWQHADFSTVREVIADQNGYYSAVIPRGKYQSMGAINMSTYPHTADPALSEQEQRLEFWAWNFIADRDTTLNIKYHRMEAYGINIFQIPGATPSYMIYVRPMSLTRYQQWIKNKTPDSILAPSPEYLGVEVTFDDEPVKVLMKQEIKEYFEEKEWGNAYLLTVDLPKNKHGRPYKVVKVKLTDGENGDMGEALYYLEKQKYF